MSKKKMELKNYPKITQEEKDLLIQLKIRKLDTDPKYSKEIFELYYKNQIEENLEAWQKLDQDGKVKVVKQIIEFEDKAISQFAFKTYKIQVNKALMYLSLLKHQQLVQWRIRK